MVKQAKKLEQALIDDLGAGMYLGEKITRAKQAMDGDQPSQRRRDTAPPALIKAQP